MINAAGEDFEESKTIFWFESQKFKAQKRYLMIEVCSANLSDANWWKLFKNIKRIWWRQVDFVWSRRRLWRWLISPPVDSCCTVFLLKMVITLKWFNFLSCNKEEKQLFFYYFRGAPQGTVLSCTVDSRLDTTEWFCIQNLGILKSIGNREHILCTTAWFCFSKGGDDDDDDDLQPLAQWMSLLLRQRLYR